MTEIESLFQAARALESTLLKERSEAARLQGELAAQAARNEAQLAQARQYAQNLLARDQQLRKYLQDAQLRYKALAARTAELERANARLGNEVQDSGRRRDLELTAARTSFEHVKRKAEELEAALEKTKPELARAREDLERAQADVLEREHRYQAALLTYQGRERNQLDAIQAIRDQLKRVQDELGQYKSRWLEAERQRQEAERARQESDRELARQVPALERARELEEANRALEQKLALEVRRRQQADSSAESGEQEKERQRLSLKYAEERLEILEAELTKAKSEAALLRAAARKNQSFPRRVPDPPREEAAPSFDELERLAMPGYPLHGSN